MALCDEFLRCPTFTLDNGRCIRSIIAAPLSDRRDGTRELQIERADSSIRRFLHELHWADLNRETTTTSRPWNCIFAKIQNWSISRGHSILKSSTLGPFCQEQWVNDSQWGLSKCSGELPKLLSPPTIHSLTDVCLCHGCLAQTLLYNVASRVFEGLEPISQCSTSSTKEESKLTCDKHKPQKKSPQLNLQHPAIHILVATPGLRVTCNLLFGPTAATSLPLEQKAASSHLLAKGCLSASQTLKQFRLKNQVSRVWTCLNIKTYLPNFPNSSTRQRATSRSSHMKQPSNLQSPSNEGSAWRFAGA